MVVLDPLKVTISNFPHSSPVEVEVPNFPGNPALGSHKVVLDRTIYIEKSDFMEVRLLFLILVGQQAMYPYYLSGCR